MKAFAVIVHPTSAHARRVADRFGELVGARGLALVDAADADLVVAFGGDGTILRAAGVAADRDLPLLGVNVGRLGFLAGATASRIEETIDRLADGAYAVESRMMLLAEAGLPGGETLRAPALNEIVVEKPTPARVARIRVMVGQEEIASYTADGFIVSTPTGSTAYSLSAGGPVVEPGLRAMVLTPVSPHAPWGRAMVVGPDRPVVLVSNEGATALSADGRQVAVLPAGAEVRVRPHDRDLKVIRLDGPGFFERLRSHLHLSPGAEGSPNP